MRKFFSFRSSSSRSESSNPTASSTKAPEDEGYWEPPWEANSKKPSSEKGQNGFQAKREDSVLRPLNCRPEEDLSNRKLRRSLSFSSAASFGASREGRSNHDRCISPSPLGHSPHHVSGCSAEHIRMKKGNHASVRQRDADDMLGSPSSSTGYHGSSVNSGYSSPVPLKCRATRLTKISSRNKTLDLYIDGEHQDKDSQTDSFYSINDGCMAGNRLLPITGRPPRAQSTAPSSRESDSDTIIKAENLYEDMLNPDGRNHSIDPIPHYDSVRCYSTEEPFRFQKKDFFRENGPTDPSEEHNTDEELYTKKKEMEQLFVALSEEDQELKNNNLNESALLQIISSYSEDRRYLAFELCSQINSRIAERNSSRERLKQTKLELDTQTRRLEKEKNELQSSLEKELDRRSSIWSSKLEKFQSEEQRLRERVRELAEQNVSIQREISLLKGNEVDTRSRIMNSETQLNDLTNNLKEARTENDDLHQTLSELQERFKAAVEERDFLEISDREKEKENKEFQKLVVRMQRMCSELENTINGLRQGYSNEIAKKSKEGGDDLIRLQLEQLRLTGVEQMLRKELESCRSEMEFLRHENMCLLDRFRDSGNGYGYSSIKLDKELYARVDCLQAQGLSLLSDNVIFCGDLLNLMKHKKYDHGQKANDDFDGYPVSEYAVKYQDLSRRVGNYKKSLQMIAAIVDEKSNLEASESSSCCTEGDRPRQLKGQISKDVEFELKAEILITRVLREKLCSKDLELEQLHADLASTVRAHDILQSEIQRLQDELSCLTHKTNDMELQLMKKNECINQLQHELKEGKKESTATRNILTKVSEEKDRMWEQLKISTERIMLLNHEVNSLEQSIDELKGDALIKEGQISILRDSMIDKPFAIICSPKSEKEISMDY